jgi:acetyl esterase
MPKDMEADDKLPVIVYYHGGGWVIADIDVYDDTPRALSKFTEAIVVSPEYRHAPENKFPAAHEDTVAAYKWTLENAATWGGDATRVAVAGESAGGNMAANVAMAARDQNLQLPVHMLLVYPVAGNDMNTESYVKNANAVPLNKPAMEWFVRNALPAGGEKDPRINLIGANLKGLPQATIITAEIDPLMSEGAVLAKKLEEAGVKTAYKNYQGVTHEFFGTYAYVDKAKAAQKYAADRLDDAFDDAEEQIRETKKAAARG